MGRTRTRRGKATRGVLGSQLREHLRERQMSSQSSEPGPRSRCWPSQEGLQGGKHSNFGEALAGKQTPCPLTQPSAMPDTSAITVLRRPSLPLRASYPLGWAGGISEVPGDSFSSATHDPAVAPGAVLSPQVCGLLEASKKWEVAVVGISLSWDPEWRGTHLDPLGHPEAGAGEWIPRPHCL